MFEIQFSPIVISLLVALIVSMVYLLSGFRGFIVSVGRRVRKDASKVLPEEEKYYPTVSVVVYAADDASNLEILLPQILEQDYPAQFEVVVVNDGAALSTKDVIARLEQNYNNLYMTFTQAGSRSLSRKKLALTLGVKASRFETIVVTMGNAQIPSRVWLKSLCRNFTPGIDVVIGYATPASPEGTKERCKRLHAFDFVRTSVEYLSWAIAGRPYRGTCYNLAYRREVFFQNKGFSRSLDLKYGDDDIFVSEVANSDNTVVELSPDSMVLDVETNPSASFKTDKLRYDYTVRRIRNNARMYFSSCSWAWWIMLGSAIAAGVFGLPSFIPAIIAMLLVVATMVTLMVVWKRTSLSLWSSPLFLTVPWFISFHPLYTLYYNIKGWRRRGDNKSWS